MKQNMALNEAVNEIQRLRAEQAAYILDLRKIYMNFEEEKNVKRLDALDAVLSILNELTVAGCTTTNEAMVEINKNAVLELISSETERSPELMDLYKADDLYINRQQLAETICHTELKLLHKNQKTRAAGLTMVNDILLEMPCVKLTEKREENHETETCD